MKELLELHINNFYFIEFVVFGLFLLIILYIINKFSPKLQLKYKSIQKIFQILPFLQAISILIFLVYFIFKIFNDSPLYYFISFIAIFSIIILGSFDYIRNIIEGVFLKAENIIELDSFIHSREFKGKVKEMGLFSLVLEEGDRKEVRIPYRLLNKDMVLKENYNKNIMEYKFRIDVKSSLDISYIERTIFDIVLNHPAITLKKMPRITSLSSSNKENLSLEIVIYSIGDNFNKEIKDKISKALNE